jgi:peptidoglycan/xylan/chitin deacetylase (PgdA/CDA1 family)
MSSRKVIIVLLFATLVVVALIGAGLLIILSDEPATTEVDPQFSGRYRLQAPSYYQGGAAPTSDVAYYLYLDGQGTARFEEERLDSGEITVIAQGTWEWDGEGADIQINELLGKPVSPPELIRYENRDGFPIAVAYAADGTLYDLEQAKFTIGAGERHPLVQELHRRMAAIDWLGFSDPGDDLFTEATRKAVVAFQEAQGLLPNGEVNAATWVLLGNPEPPIPTPAPPPAAALPPAEGGTGDLGVPDLDNLPTHTQDGKPIAYFTFDDGPSGFTQQLVDLFAQYNGQATFFVLGQQVDAQPKIVRATAQAGHYIANHSYSHTSLEGISSEGFLNEVERTRQAILNAAGDLFTLDKDVRYLRPPYGATDANTRQYAANLGYAVVMWDIDPQDWRQPGADILANHIVSSVYPGAIVLSHDGGGDRTQTVQAYEKVLADLSAQGYAFRNIFASP